MNKIIKELIEQATKKEEFYPAGCNGYPEYRLDFNKENFAELIIKECADIAKHNVMNISTYADAEFVEKQIKTHFGMNNE